MPDKTVNKKIGRPTALVPIVVEKLEEALRWGATIEQACAHAKIDRGTYHNHTKKDETFSTRMQYARNYVNLKAKHNVGVAIDEGDLNTSKWQLEKTEYNKPQQANVQVNIANILQKEKEEFNLDE
ncbi:hypothetical protein DRQ25_18330 [Candidatus Fermentibacteria bacterium]|nr:MAG: hypothetical protein DRQ25_18330 [Candidatus Fermentibacteria bacterium]